MIMSGYPLFMCVGHDAQPVGENPATGIIFSVNQQFQLQTEAGPESAF